MYSPRSPPPSHQGAKGKGTMEIDNNVTTADHLSSTGQGPKYTVASPKKKQKRGELKGGSNTISLLKRLEQQYG